MLASASPPPAQPLTMSPNDVTRLTTYVVNFQPEMRSVINEVRQRILPANPPVSTLLGVQALARPELMIEVEATAVLP